MDEKRDTTFEDVAGESGEAASNLAAHIGAMPSEELLALADDLRSLMAHPGWGKLLELVELKQRAIERGASTLLWKRLASGKAIQQQGPYLRMGGMVAGLREPEAIIGKVLRTAKIVRTRLGIDGEGS